MARPKGSKNAVRTKKYMKHLETMEQEPQVG